MFPGLRISWGMFAVPRGLLGIAWGILGLSCSQGMLKYTNIMVYVQCSLGYFKNIMRYVQCTQGYVEDIMGYVLRSMLKISWDMVDVHRAMTIMRYVWCPQGFVKNIVG